MDGYVSILVRTVAVCEGLTINYIKAIFGTIIIPGDIYMDNFKNTANKKKLESSPFKIIILLINMYFD